MVITSDCRSEYRGSTPLHLAMNLNEEQQAKFETAAKILEKGMEETKGFITESGDSQRKKDGLERLLRGEITKDEFVDEVKADIATFEKEKENENSLYWKGRLDESLDNYEYGITSVASGDWHARNGEPMTYKHQYDTLKAFYKSGAMKEVTQKAIEAMKEE
jgi:hypothetical protein